LLLQLVAHLPHLEVDSGVGEFAEKLGKPPRIDYEKINPEEAARFLSSSEKLVRETMLKLGESYNPLKVISSTFVELGTLGHCIFPQIRTVSIGYIEHFGLVYRTPVISNTFLN